jgi:hypothetical protein
MRVRSLILSLFLAIPTVAPCASAQSEASAAAERMIDEACAARPVQWHCMGEMVLGQDWEQGGLRVRAYLNREQLVELKAPPIGHLRKLSTRSGDFYDGFEEKEIPLKNPLWMSGMAFATPLSALMEAFPEGPDSVPGRASTRVVKAAVGNVNLTAWRQADGEVRFTVRTQEQGEISGSYRAGLLAPLPGDFSLNGWRRPAPLPGQAAQPEFDRLDQAR